MTSNETLYAVPSQLAFKNYATDSEKNKKRLLVSNPTTAKQHVVISYPLSPFFSIKPPGSAKTQTSDDGRETGVSCVLEPEGSASFVVFFHPPTQETAEAAGKAFDPQNPPDLQDVITLFSAITSVDVPLQAVAHGSTPESFVPAEELQHQPTPPANVFQVFASTAPIHTEPSPPKAKKKDKTQLHSTLRGSLRGGDIDRQLKKEYNDDSDFDDDESVVEGPWAQDYAQLSDEEGREDEMDVARQTGVLKSVSPEKKKRLLKTQELESERDYYLKLIADDFKGQATIAPAALKQKKKPSQVTARTRVRMAAEEPLDPESQAIEDEMQRWVRTEKLQQQQEEAASRGIAFDGRSTGRLGSGRLASNRTTNRTGLPSSTSTGRAFRNLSARQQQAAYGASLKEKFSHSPAPEDPATNERFVVDGKVYDVFGRLVEG